MTFTPHPANSNTLAFFKSQGVEWDAEYGRFVFAALDSSTVYDSDEWVPAFVETRDGIRYPVAVRGADCGAACRCGAEISIVEGTADAVRQVTVNVPADQYSRAVIGTWQDPNNARIATDDDLAEVAQTAVTLAYENAEEFCTDIPRYRDILNRVIDGPSTRDEIAERIADAIVLDEPVDGDPVEDWWSDVTLTTVVAPHLAHIAQKMAEEGWDEQVAALNKAIDIVHNWRG